MPTSSYYRRVLAAYLGRGRSHLSFWHEKPAVNERAFEKDSIEYYMTFAEKARYAGPFDDQGIPQLDYRGAIGRRYNPIAIAQYGLACFNYWKHAEFLNCADWLVRNLKPNSHGVPVWMHEFDWEYFRTLRAPWYSGLAQGQGVSLLLRAHRATEDTKYMNAAQEAFASLLKPVEDGGVLLMDPSGHGWIEEYITEPPTHILNGFLWALWGVWDWLRFVETKGPARELWEKSLATLEQNLPRFDAGYWSLYDLAPVGRKNVASLFYHRLHIVQLDVMYRLSGREVFRAFRDRWQGYADSAFKRHRAWLAKVMFKLTYY
ncbi:MAG: D-glucuronyl C5-epimerase family protein [Verrucomicrobia bacterium]|nr:D-glucuronyl C5-epimerase family protein [Verrucomicrobiota bacterium]